MNPNFRQSVRRRREIFPNGKQYRRNKFDYLVNLGEFPVILKYGKRFESIVANVGGTLFQSRSSSEHVRMGEWMCAHTVNHTRELPNISFAVIANQNETDSMSKQSQRVGLCSPHGKRSEMATATMPSMNLAEAQK